ncbi:MAG: DUF421 domain-containing protein [Bacillota bacterium]|nr:DUF421 domain-containing protein [Bacillota bacterium]
MFTVFFRTILIYVIILIVMRLMGKREIGQLSVFDLVVAIMIAEVAVFPMEDLTIPLYMGLLPLFVLAGAEILLSWLCLRFTFFRRITDGYPSVLIFKGKVNEKEMRKQRYNINDLIGQLRQKSIFNISDVEYAILETSGDLSVMVKNTKRPVNPEDLNISPLAEDIPVPLILDGAVLQKNLDYLGLTRSWLEEELKVNELDVKEIIYANLDSQGQLYISEKDSSGRNSDKGNRRPVF